MGTGGAANDPGTLGLPESVTSAVAKMPSLMQLPLRAATALLAPGSGEVGTHEGQGRGKPGMHAAICLTGLKALMTEL